MAHYNTPFDIADVAGLLGIRRLTNGTNSFDVECPFCHDKRRKCNLCVTKGGKTFNTYNCFACGASGNMLTLYADIRGLSGADRNKRAYREIRDGVQGGADVCAPNGNRKERTEVAEAERTAPRVLDDAYRTLTDILDLTEAHRKGLLKRGFTDEQIDRIGFRSTPKGGSEAVASRLIKKGRNPSGVPGFFVNNKGRWDSAFYQGNYGILCPVTNADGLTAGFQIRLDRPINKRKYVWFSSTNRDRGATSGSPIAVFGDPDAETAYVTEGPLKAALSYCLSGNTFIGVPGVNQCRNLKETLLKLKECGLKNIIEAHDMDKHMGLACGGDYDDGCVPQECECHDSDGTCSKKAGKRATIRKGCTRLYDVCRELNLNVKRRAWDQNKDGLWAGNFKGIDDHLLYLKGLESHDYEPPPSNQMWNGLETVFIP